MHRRATALLVALMLAATACGSDGGGTEGQQGGPVRDEGLTATDGGTFVFGLEAEADGLSPTRSRFAITGHLVASAVFDPLADFDDETNEVVPFLAESIEPSEDLQTWTITLREGVTFHDGTALDAAAVVRNLEAHTESALTQAAFADVDTITEIDARTVQVTTKQPWASFPYILTTQAGYVQAPSMLDDPEGANRPVGTGPFVFENWVQGDRWSGVKNDSYWREGLPHVDRIEFRTIPDDLTRLAALTAGDVDMTHTDYGPDVANFRETEDLAIFEDGDGEEEFIILNLATEPFNSLTARQAVAHATDLQDYADTIGPGVLAPINGPFAEGQIGYEEDTGYPQYDPARAAELVAQYEQEEGKPLRIELASVPTPQGLNEIQLLKDQWESVGMEVELYTSEQAAHILRVITGAHQAAYWRLFSSVDPDGDYVWWHGRNAVDPPGISLNFARNRDEQLDAALDRARQTLDPEVRDEAYKEAARRMGETLPYIWLSRVTWAYAARPQVHGIDNILAGGLGSLAAKTWVGEIWLEQ